MKIQTLLALIVTSVAMTSCGEVYEATYRGTGTVQRSCDDKVPPGTYEFAIRAKVGDGITARIVDIRPNAAGGSSISTDSLSNVIMNAGFTGDKNDFSATGIPAYSDSISDSGEVLDAYNFRGNLSTDRATLTINYEFASRFIAEKKCATEMTGTFLREQ